MALYLNSWGALCHISQLKKTRTATEKAIWTHRFFLIVAARLDRGASKSAAARCHDRR
jgi:hypothetical protein